MPDESPTAFVFAHFDDSILSAFSAISACTEPGLDIVVFGGAWEGQAGTWDRACGFSTAREAVHRRRYEHLNALSFTGLEHVTLDGIDAQYPPSDRILVQRELWKTLHAFRPRTIVTHMSDAYHDDHRRVASWVRTYADGQSVTVVEVGDRPYHACRDHCQGGRRTLQLEDAVWTQKRAAVAAYHSQVQPLASVFGSDWSSRERLGWECYREAAAA
jgi:LmbE family N-acetylglucosaminyl deacetylase